MLPPLSARPAKYRFHAPHLLRGRLQAVATLPHYDGNYAALGSWIAAGQPCGLSVREDVSPITKNTSRFLPHAIVG